MAADTAVIATPIEGVRLVVAVVDGELVGIDFFHSSDKQAPPLCEPESAPVRQLLAQLQAYFVDPHAAFDFPISLSGSAFQQRVWQAMRTIEAGRTCSYGALAEQLGSSARAVGNACGANPIPIIVPCHRVVAAHGPGGFMGRRDGWQMMVKRWLLAHEGGVWS